MNIGETRIDYQPADDTAAMLQPESQVSTAKTLMTGSLAFGNETVYLLIGIILVLFILTILLKA
jgi:hypothetical protein